MFIYATNNKTKRKTYRLFLLAVVASTCVFGCEKPSTNPLPDNSNSVSVEDIPLPHTQSQNHLLQDTEDTQADLTQTTPLHIDWSAIDSGVDPVSPEVFDYPFAENSNVVTEYASYFDISAQAARHSLTVGTASNEPLSALLHQLGDSYIAHQITDGADIKLVITTTPNVSPSTYDYVIENEFARGLILPIIIEPKNP